MSVIAHWIENAGISTVVIGLVKEHLVKIKPPRALWVPFELGRPIGAPRDPAFQTKVLRTALEMTSRQLTTAVLDDFDGEDPRANPDEQWRAPAIQRTDKVTREVNALLPAHKRFVDKYNRTSIGVAGINIDDSATLMEALAVNDPTHSPRSDTSPTLMARYIIDDLKSFYFEAALASGSPNSEQLQQWFWQQTHLGAEIQRLRQRWMSSDIRKLNIVGERFLIPHRWRAV